VKKLDQDLIDEIWDAVLSRDADRVSAIERRGIPGASVAIFLINEGGGELFNDEELAERLALRLPPPVRGAPMSSLFNTAPMVARIG
jgi:hypothetical protein